MADVSRYWANSQEQPGFGEMIGTIMCVKLLFSDLQIYQKIYVLFIGNKSGIYDGSLDTKFSQLKDSNKAL